MSLPCPCCDLEASKADPLAAFALGAAVGCSRGGQFGAAEALHAVSDLMCPAHRGPYVMAMVRAHLVMQEATP